MGVRHRIAIIGAGPAGLAAAIVLAEAGHEVRVLERRSRGAPPKPCGDGLTPKALGVLTRLGLASDVRRLAHEPKGVAWQSPAGAIRTFVPPPRGRSVVLPRRTLERLLRERARAAGAQMERERNVRSLLTTRSGRVAGAVVAGGRRYPAELMVIASGAVARFGARDERPLWWGAQAVVRPTRPHEWLRFDFIEALLPGYAWFFPSGDGLVNVGYGTIAATRRRPLDPATRAAARAHIHRVLPEARGARFRAAPIACFPRAPSRPGALLVGDAAGLANVFTGEGIYHALLSGVLAATTVCEHGVSARTEGCYVRSLDRCLALDRRGARLMSAIARHVCPLEWSMSALALPLGMRLLNVAMAFERPAWLLERAGLPAQAWWKRDFSSRLIRPGLDGEQRA